VSLHTKCEMLVAGQHKLVGTSTVQLCFITLSTVIYAASTVNLDWLTVSLLLTPVQARLQRAGSVW